MTRSGPPGSPPSIARGILDQARPIYVGQVAVMLYGVVDTVLTGHASATDLAAMGLGTGVYSSVFVTVLGVLNALSPIIGQHHGGGRHTAIGVSYVQGLWLALLLAVAGGLFLAFPELWLGWIHAPPEVEALVTRYLRILAVALPAALMFRVISVMNVAVARPHVVMRMQVAGLALKVVLSYGLIFGALGMPRLGAVGGALASAVVFWALFVTGWVYTSLDPFYARFVIVRARPRWSVLREQVQLGIPMGLSYAIEATSFTFITLMVARLGTSVMAGHQVVANLAALCFMVPLSLAVATSTLTAHAIGAEDAERARRTAATGIRIALIAGASLALAVWVLRHPIVRLYTSDAAAGAVALTLVPFLAVFHLFDALQTAVGFVLRAHKRAVAPTVVYAIALWGVGLFGGYQVAFRGVWGPPRGVTGMWLMQSVGLGLAAALLLAFYVRVVRRRR
ncbi:MAG TPA: MATE family efflux transporter [Methylomirabilota bacterium]|nr:MATE family efflux transporter [Methylomirabilota bacterium]